MKSFSFLLLKALLLVVLAIVSYHAFFWIGESYERNRILKIGEKGAHQAIQFFKDYKADKAIAMLYLSESLSEYRRPENEAKLEKETACLLGRGFLLKSKYCLAESYLKYAETLSYTGGLSELCSKTYERMEKISESCSWKREQIYSILQRQDSQ